MKNLFSFSRLDEDSFDQFNLISSPSSSACSISEQPPFLKNSKIINQKLNNIFKPKENENYNFEEELIKMDENVIENLMFERSYFEEPYLSLDFSTRLKIVID